MKVLIINGSPRTNGNTSTALREMEKIFESESVEYEQIQIGGKSIAGCCACGRCSDIGRCVFDDEVNKAVSLLEECDGMVIGSPVYYSMPNGSLVSFLQRLFYSSHSVDKTMKVGAVVVAARRAGTTASFDVLNKFFTISQMPVVSGQYWNNVFGREEGECTQDDEGLQNARVVARNMVFLMKAIRDAKENYGLPQKEARTATNFIR